MKVTTDCKTCLDFFRFETKVGPAGEDTCAGDSGLTGQTFLLIKSTIGGPLVTEDGDSNFLLMGIVRGGGVECSRVNDPNYTWENKTGDWMRVAAFKDVWIDQVIEEDTRVGKEI